jgi:hypothetical protein
LDLPNGKPLVTATKNGVNDSHGPYVSGNGHATHEDASWDVGTLVTWEPDPTAHWVSDSDCWKGACNHLAPITKVPTGPNVPGWFKSEFGCVTWSSFESVSPMLHEADYGLHTQPMFERNWPVDNVIKSYFGMQQELNATGEAAFKKQLYQSMIGQSLFIKAEIEGWRYGARFLT